MSAGALRIQERLSLLLVSVPKPRHPCGALELQLQREKNHPRNKTKMKLVHGAQFLVAKLKQLYTKPVQTVTFQRLTTWLNLGIYSQA